MTTITIPRFERLDDAVAFGDQLKAEITDIELQLSDRNKATAEGDRMTADEYWQWNSKAKSALRAKKMQLAKVKEQVARLRSQTTIMMPCTKEQRERFRAAMEYPHDPETWIEEVLEALEATEATEA